jgi:hypothetical protein
MTTKALNTESKQNKWETNITTTANTIPESSIRTTLPLSGTSNLLEDAGGG